MSLSPLSCSAEQIQHFNLHNGFRVYQVVIRQGGIITSRRLLFSQECHDRVPNTMETNSHPSLHI